MDYSLYEIKSINKCNCGRPWCDYFSGAVGDKGRSFGKEEIKEIRKDVKKAIKNNELEKCLKYLDKLLK